MPLTLKKDFHFAASVNAEETIAQALLPFQNELREQSLYFGFQSLSNELKKRFHLQEIDHQVDNFTRLGSEYGYETIPSLVTLGLRQSRFAPLLVWEIFHLLKLGGTWLDLDQPERCQGTPLSNQDFLERAYYQPALECVSTTKHSLRARLWRKKAPAPISNKITDEGWTFGILTAGQSPNAQQMIRTILEIPGPKREIIICGPAQKNLPEDSRICTIDLEKPEPRGWITRKKNLIVDAARYSNLCLMHDRFIFPQDFFSVMGNYGNDFSVVTFPEPYYLHQNRSIHHRYPDYQVLRQKEKLQLALDSKVFQQDSINYLNYDDFHETAFCCGGVYVTKKSLWNMVRQDEALYHAESEDVLFGLQCQQLGIPHRVIATTDFESLAPHPLGLINIPIINSAGERNFGFPVVNEDQQKDIPLNPADYLPVIACPREAYYLRVAERFNAIPRLPDKYRLTTKDYRSAEKLSDFWTIVYQRLKKLPVNGRDEIAAIYHFFSNAVYNWPNAVIQSWIRNTELSLSRVPMATIGKKLIGWGTGGVYRNLATSKPQQLAYLIDNSSQRWGEQLDGLKVCSPEQLLLEDPTNTLVILYSSFVTEIGQQIEQLGPYQYTSATNFFAGNEYFPIQTIIGYYREVERHYPKIFTDSVSIKPESADL